MKLTLQLKLLPTAEQSTSLLNTMRQFNAAASFAAKAGFDAGVFSRPSIQKLCYRELRDKFGISSQMAIRAIGKAADAFARDKTICPVFSPEGAMIYDDRIISFKDCNRVSILSVDAGRLMIPYVFGEYQKARLDRLKGQIDLVYRDGQFYLYCTIDMPEDPTIEVHDFIGIDMGIVNILVDSDGNTSSGEKVEKVRRKFQRTRQRLQQKGTKAAKRILKRIRHRESNFRRHENHVISKKVVQNAKDTGRGIGLENLKFIRDRLTVRQSQRNRHHGWSFFQLRSCIEYKAKLVGVPVIAVDPRNSSRTCSECGHCDKANRKTQSDFACLGCGMNCNADINAARVLRDRARAACKSASLVASRKV